MRLRSGRGAALALLFCINLFNYIDRQVLAAVEPDVKHTLLRPDDPHARTKMGLLSTAFLLAYLLSAPLFGRLAERWPRWPLIAVGVALWSLASGASGLAMTFTAMLLTRCFVGVGEGAYGPIAPDVISDLYPQSSRGRVLSFFYLAIPVGAALGYALGGQVAAWDRAHESWRWAFYLVVAPGILLALWSFLMSDPQRGAADGLRGPSRRANIKDYLILLRTPSYVLDTLGMTAMTFAIGAMAWWIPDYLHTHHVPDFHGIEPRVFFGVLTALAGLIATPLGGIVGDRLRGRVPGAYFLVSGLSLVLTVPCVLLFLAVPFNTAWGFIFLAEFFLFFNTGPSNTILANVAHPAMRATAFGLNIFIIHILGDAISPPVVGAIADAALRLGASQQHALDYGFIAVSAFLLLGGILWLLGTRHLEPDTAAATRRL